MIPYILIFLLVFLGVLYELNLKYTNSAIYISFHSVIYFFIVLSVALMSGFRDMLGGYDVFVYARFFQQVPPIGDIIRLSRFDPVLYSHFEPGYLFLNSLVKTISTDKYFLFFIFAILTYLFIAKAFYRYPLYIFAFSLFFAKFFIVAFVYTRQCIAMGIVWWGIMFLEKNRKYIFILILIVATSIHYSAFVVFPLYIISHWKFSRTCLLSIFVLSFALGITPFIKWGMDFINKFLVLDKLDGYAEAVQSTFHIPYFIETSLLACCVLKYKDTLYKNERMGIVLNMLILYIVFSFLTLRDSGVVRFIWYFFLGYAVLVPFFMRKIIKDKVLVFILVLAYFGFVYFRNVTVRNEGGNVPYKSIFMNVKRTNQIYD